MASMIEWWAGERAVRLSCVPRLLAPRHNGRAVHRDTVYRWTTEGMRGVVLRRFLVGGQWHTTREELARWVAGLNLTRTSSPAGRATAAG